MQGPQERQFGVVLEELTGAGVAVKWGSCMGWRCWEGPIMSGLCACRFF